MKMNNLAFLSLFCFLSVFGMDRPHEGKKETQKMESENAKLGSELVRGILCTLATEGEEKPTKAEGYYLLNPEASTKFIRASFRGIDSFNNTSEQANLDYVKGIVNKLFLDKQAIFSKETGIFSSPKVGVSEEVDELFKKKIAATRLPSKKKAYETYYKAVAKRHENAE